MSTNQSITIREMIESDRAVWLRMRAALWPEATVDDHAHDIGRVFGSADEWAFIVEAANGELAGFAEVAIRKYANGCESQPVPFLEGIWVEPQFRKSGISEALVAHIERFFVERGFREIGSDALIDNTVSHTAHAKWGFVETERVVCFRKRLG